MTRKERILQLIQRLDDDVSCERVIYHLGVLNAIEIGEAEFARGEFIEHADLVRDSINQDTKELFRD